MRPAEAVEDGLARPRERHQDLAMVGFTVRTAEQAAVTETVHEFDGAVMADEQARGKLADDGPRALGQAGDGQQKLMLARLQAMRTRLLLAKVQKTVDLEAEIRQQPDVGLGEGLNCAHRYIVPRYIFPVNHPRSNGWALKAILIHIWRPRCHGSPAW